MTNSGLWKSHQSLGLADSVLVLFADNSDLLQGLERKACDLGEQATSRTPSHKIAVIALDDASIANVGRWPWPRDVHAKMTDLLAAAGAKVIVDTIFFSEPQPHPDDAYVRKLPAMARQRRITPQQTNVSGLALAHVANGGKLNPT